MKSKLEMLSDGLVRSVNENIDVFMLDKEHYQVTSKGNLYTVGVHGREVTTCDCPHFTYRNIPCKHMAKVKDTFNKSININHFNLV